jgi:hypothetical protein
MQSTRFAIAKKVLLYLDLVRVQKLNSEKYC